MIGFILGVIITSVFWAIVFIKLMRLHANSVQEINDIWKKGFEDMQDIYINAAAKRID